MPSFRCNNLVVLKHHRIRSSTHSNRTVDPDLNGRLKSVSVSSTPRRSTRVSIPPTLIHTSNEVLQNNLRVQPTVFFYNKESFEEPSYQSVEEIRAIKDDECLWIDVTDVSVK